MEKEEVKEIKRELEQASRLLSAREKNFVELEKDAESKFLESIKGFANHKKYDNLKVYLQLITNDSKINCLVVCGENGIGKSLVVRGILKGLSKPIYYINSYTTALAFYKAIYYHRYDNIILDDVFGLYEDERGIAILRAMVGTEEVRYVRYQSTSEKLDVPSSFIFYGTLTILTNKITEKMNDSLLDRAIYRNIRFTLKEKFDFIEKIAMFNYNLKEQEIKEISDFIRENTDETTKEFSFRTIIKIIEFYIFDKKNWKVLATEELEKDEELIFVKEIMLLPIKERNERWIEERGRSIRTLQRRIKELNDKTT